MVLSWAAETCSLYLHPLQKTLLDRTGQDTVRRELRVGAVALFTRVTMGPSAAYQGDDCDHLQGK